MKRKWHKIIGIFLIVAGICVFCFPIINRAIVQRENDMLLQAAKEKILKSMQEQKENEEGGSTEPKPSVDLSSDLDFLNIPLQESDELPKKEENVLESDRLSGQELAGIIEIKAIDLVYAIVEGTEKHNIGVAIGHFKHSAPIGAEGNCALAGHRGGYSGPYFKDIDQLVEGDEIKVTDLHGDEYLYTVIKSFVVEPTDTYVVGALEEKGRLLTLVSCTNNGTKRLIVRAKIEE